MQGEGEVCLFGYIKVDKSELKVKEYELYKAVYCTLCKESGKRYGFLARMTLSYDFTFLSLLSLAQNGEEPAACQGRCVVNPLKKCSYICSGKGSAFHMAAAASVILLYYKLQDDKTDERGVKRLLYRMAQPFVKRPHKKAAADFPQIEKIAANYYTAQLEAEKDRNCSLDKAGEPTAKMLAELCKMSGPERSSRVLERMGYCVGKWIYLLDAVEDNAADNEKGRFNPFGRLDQEQIKERAVPLLNNCFAEAANAYELLDVRRFGTVLENILYLGLKQVQTNIIEKREWKKNERSV